jgi:hypothetical protein
VATKPELAMLCAAARAMTIARHIEVALGALDSPGEASSDA